MGKIVCRQAAVGSQTGTLRLTTDSDTGNRVLREGESRDFAEVPAITLDDEFGDQITCPCLLKADVEGFEWEVIQGASRFLKNPNVKVLLLETFRPHNFMTEKLKSIEARLRDHGFDPFGYDVRANRLDPLMEPQDGGNNTLYVREREWVESRLADSALKQKR